MKWQCRKNIGSLVLGMPCSSAKKCHCAIGDGVNGLLPVSSGFFVTIGDGKKCPKLRPQWLPGGISVGKCRRVCGRFEEISYNW